MMKLFVGNLAPETTEQDVSEALATVGPVLNFHRPSDFTTGKPRSFAFVTMEDRETGDKAIEVLNQTQLDGRDLRVNEAEERRPGNPADRPKWVSMKVPKQRPVDDRPIGPDGKKVRYKSI